jgi:hypothetical protein
MSEPDLSLIQFWKEPEYRPSAKWLQYLYIFGIVFAVLAVLCCVGAGIAAAYKQTALLVPLAISFIVLGYSSSALLWQQSAWKSFVGTYKKEDVPNSLCPAFFTLRTNGQCTNEHNLMYNVAGRTDTKLPDISSSKVVAGMHADLANYPMYSKTT